jgi:hypothetical protein
MRLRHTTVGCLELAIWAAVAGAVIWFVIVRLK